MRAVVSMGLLVLSSIASADPTVYKAKPLAAGQWVTYRERVGGREVGTVSIVAGNRGACGMYFEVVLVGGHTKKDWMFCVDDDHRLVEATLDGKSVVLHEHLAELGALLTRVLPPQFVGAFVTEDITVPAGRFSGALRKDGDTTTWVHPDVPLGAVVRVKQGDREDVLTAFADAPAVPTASTSSPTKMPSLVRAFPGRRSTPMYVELGYGYSGLSGIAAGRSNRLDLLRETIGLVAGDFDIVAAVAMGDTTAGETNPALATKVTTIGAGVRLWPLGRTREPRALVDTMSVFAQVTGGYSRLENMTLVGNGVGASAAVGWKIQTMRDWAWTVQVFDDVAYDDGHVGFRNTVGVSVALDLWIL